MNAEATQRSTSLIAIGIALSLSTVTFVSTLWLHRLPPATPASLAVALLPMPFYLAAFAAAFHFARRFDEMQRRIQFEALAFAYPIVMIVVLGLRFAHAAGYVLPFHFGNLFSLMIVAYGLGIAVAWRRYR